MHLSARLAHKFLRERLGGVAMITAIVMFPLLFFAVGTPIDLARQMQFRSALQNIADGAATAGAKVLADGATGAQACTMAQNFAAASLTGSVVSLSSTNVTVTEAAYPSVAGDTVTNCGTQNTGVIGTTPNEMTVVITAKLPATFMSIIKPTLPVSVSSTAVGPSSFVYACITPSPSTAGDYDAAYFYLVAPNGTSNDVTGTPITRNAAINPLDKMIDNQEGVGDSAIIGGKGSNAINEQCGPGSAQTPPATWEVPIQVGLGNRVGFMMADETGKINSGDYSNSGKNAYGTPLLGTQYFYSTDYPATLNTTNGTVSLTIGGTSHSNVNGYSAAIQTLLINTSCTKNPTDCPYYKKTSNSRTTNYGDYVYFTSEAQEGIYAGSSNVDLVCLVSNGAPVTPSTTTRYNDLNPQNGLTTSTEYLVHAGGSTEAYTIVGITTTTQMQQQNLVLSNSKDGSAIYQCANTVIGSDYNVDPTCTELGSNVLAYSWNDMGGDQTDQDGYGDLPFTFSCSSAATDATPRNVTLIQ